MFGMNPNPFLFSRLADPHQRELLATPASRSKFGGNLIASKSNTLIGGAVDEDVEVIVDILKLTWLAAKGVS